MQAKVTVSKIEYSAEDASEQVKAVLSRARHYIRVWRERARQRSALRCLEPHQLQDIGVTAEQARQEAAKPFWKA